MFLTADSSTVVQFEPKPQQPQQQGSRHFLQLRPCLMQSPNWKSLQPGPRALYTAMADLYNGHNNGRISYSARDAAKELGVSEATAWRWQQILIEHHLIARTKKGHFDWRTKKAMASEWTLLEWEQSEHSPTFTHESRASSPTFIHARQPTFTHETKYINKKESINKNLKRDSEFQFYSQFQKARSLPKEAKPAREEVHQGKKAPSEARASSATSSLPPEDVPRGAARDEAPPANEAMAAAAEGLIAGAAAGMKRMRPAVNNTPKIIRGVPPSATKWRGARAEDAEQWLEAEGRTPVPREPDGSILVPDWMALEVHRWVAEGRPQRYEPMQMAPALGPPGDSLADFADYGV